jgi:hypothetical protein
MHNFFENYKKENLFRMQQADKPLVQLMFLNHSERFQDWWYVEPTKIPDKHRSADRPLSYNYDIQLVGVKPFMANEKVDDTIARSVGDYGARAKELQKAIEKNLKAIDKFELPGIAKSVMAKIAQVKGYIKTVSDALKAGMAAVKKVMKIIKTVVDAIIDVVNDLKQLVRSAFSNIYELIHSMQQVKCACETVFKFPIDLYSDINSDIRQLKKKLQQSGCGTSMRSAGPINGKIGYEAIT